MAAHGALLPALRHHTASRSLQRRGQAQVFSYSVHAPRGDASRRQRLAATSEAAVPGSTRRVSSQARTKTQPKNPAPSTLSSPVRVLEPPLSALDVDAELWQVLDLCSDEELEAVYSVLHAPSPFSPVVKSLVTENEPPLVQQRGRLSLMHKVEARFRFLAADQTSLLRGARPSYRDTLLAIRDRIDVPCSTNLSTFDLETEVFLHVLNNCLDYVQGDESLGSPAEAAARATLNDGDGMSAAATAGGGRRQNWVERVTAPILFGVKELVPTLAKLGSAITVTAVGHSTASQLALKLASSHLHYQAAVRACAAASRGVAGALTAAGRQSLLEGAARGLQSATARYSAVQGAMSFIGPVMWGWLALDLAFKAIGTDYARVIRAVFILAQVRLLRTHGFTNPEGLTSTAAAVGAGSKGVGAAQGGKSKAGASQQAVSDVNTVVVEAVTTSEPVVAVAHPIPATPPYQGPPYHGPAGPSSGPPGASGEQALAHQDGAGGYGGQEEEEDDPHARIHDVYN